MVEAETFCSCIKKVKKTRKGMKEGTAIAICTKSVLQSRGRTLKKFHCKKHPHLTTQPMKGGQASVPSEDEEDPRFRSIPTSTEPVAPTSSADTALGSAPEFEAELTPEMETERPFPDAEPSGSGPVDPANPVEKSAPAAARPPAAPPAPLTDEDRRRAARKVVDIVERLPLPPPVRKPGYKESDVNPKENFVILNPESKFVIVTYWWGKYNINRNVEHPCVAYERTARQDIRTYVQEYDYIKAIEEPEERETAIAKEVEDEYRGMVQANIADIAKSLRIPEAEAREILLRKTPALSFRQMIERFKKDCVKAKCNFLVQEYEEFTRPLYQAAINGKPVFIRKAIEACRGLGTNGSDLAVVYIDGDMRANIYPKIFDMAEVDFMARGWSMDPRSNKRYLQNIVCFDPYIFETSGGIQYFANTAGSLDLLETWKLSNLANPGKADDRVISLAFNVLKYHQALSFIQLPIEYLWLTDNYLFQDPDNTSQRKAIVEHPECLTAEDAAEGASASREPLYYEKLITNVIECKRAGGAFYEYVFFERPDLVETMGPYLDYLKNARVTEEIVKPSPEEKKRKIKPRGVKSSTPLFKVVPYAEKYGEHTATAEANLAAAEQAPDAPPTEFNIPAILKQLRAGKDVKIGSTPELEAKIATGALDFIAHVKPGEEKGMDPTYPDAKPVFDLTKPMFLSGKHRVLREVLTMCSPDTVTDVFNESYTFLSRIRCYWLK